MSKVARCTKCEEILPVECCRCGHNWRPKKDEVVTCPNKKCKSPYWNVPKTPKTPAEEETA